jgi:hypothetical protein
MRMRQGMQYTERHLREEITGLLNQVNDLQNKLQESGSLESGAAGVRNIEQNLTEFNRMIS